MIRNGRGPTLKDVAMLAGVSTMTASRALGAGVAVRPVTRDLVLKAVETLGYVQNHTARAFSARGSRMVALIVPNVSNSVFASTIEAMNDVLSTAGYSLAIGYSGYSRRKEERILRSLLGYQPDAVVLTGFTHTRDTRALLARLDRPVVETWNIGPDAIDMAVGFSNWAAAREMTRFLIGRGHRRLAYAGGTQTDNDRTQARERGFREALADSGLEIREDWILSLPMELESGAALARNLGEGGDRPEALFAASDIIASGFVMECQRLGIRVPAHIAVAGFDDTPLARAIEPPLTTVRVPQREIGRKSAELILARLSGRSDHETVYDLGFEITVRASA